MLSSPSQMPGVALATAGLTASPPPGAAAPAARSEPADAPPTDGSPDAVGEAKPADAPVYKTDEFRIK
jgi:hypothetical protein